LVVISCVAALAAVVAPSSATTGRTTSHFATATHREPPAFPWGNYVKRPLRIVSIVPNTGSTGPTAVTSRLLKFGKVLVISPWYAAMNTAYGLGGSTGTAIGVRANVAGLGSNPTNLQVSEFVNRVAHAAHIAPDPAVKTLWTVYYHCTSTSQRLSRASCGSADHESPSLRRSVTNWVFEPLDSLALVMVNASQWHDSESALSLATRNASHEVIEGTTDRGNKGYFLADTDHAKPWLGGSPWTEVQSSNGTEVGDQGRVYGTFIRYHDTNHTTPAASFTYDFARVFVNHAASLGGDPDRPASPVPYYNTSTPKDWYRLPTSGTKQVSIPVDAWSIKSEKSWTLTANVHGYAGLGTTGASAPCSTSSLLIDSSGHSASLSHGVVVNNGQVPHLEVKYHPGATSSWYIFELESTRTGHEPGGTGHPDTNADNYRSWIVGVHV
jgi:hypothetical protein